MLVKDQNVFILLESDSSQRILRQGVVIECNDESFTAQFTETLALQVGQSVLAHAEVNRRFMQQGATVTALLEDPNNLTIVFNRVGEPISAESRNAFRVSVAAANLTAVVADDKSARLLDVSATGFGVVSSEKLKVGQMLEATLSYNGQSYTGPARVQCVKDYSPTQYRYGLHAVEERRFGKKNADLTKGLATISSAVQREQLNRLARA
ncbi:MAG: hypothetical protein GC164_08240 [Phycisphaera sp.]|nr:hypothetical protein [Phycisphaera sp.]